MTSEDHIEAAEMVREARGKNVVHETRLNNLIEKWREDEDEYGDDYHAYRDARDCADELEELIDDGR